MLRKHFKVAVVFSLVLPFSNLGCNAPGDSTNRNTTIASQSDSHAITNSWKIFVDRVKSRESFAKGVWMKREGHTDQQIVWNSNDVRKTDSFATPVVGEMSFNVTSWWRVNALPENTFKYQYKFEFVPNGDTWEFSKGTQRRLDKGYEGPEPEAVNDLKKAGRHIESLFTDVNS
ncbi:MAG: hypothetical protein JWM11_1079 [Planctomycetaceae bacterium]|nr:hypothetical protein [Planctomycetaceae bacterium]